MYDIEVQSQYSERLYPVGETVGYATLHANETWVYAKADLQAERLNQYTYGEPLRVLAQQHNGFARVQSLRDSYSGWVQENSLCLCNNEPAETPYRTICVAPVTAQPDLKSPLITVLPPDACVSPANKINEHLLIPNLGWIHRRHVSRFNTKADLILTARSHLGRSYVWGGRGVAGLDCSALTQLCYRSAGYNIPRDSDLQEYYLKSHHKSVELCELERGDLIFFPGHVMIASDAYTVIHASAFHMRVVVEDLNTVVRRAKAEFGADIRLHGYRWQEKQPFVHVF